MNQQRQHSVLHFHNHSSRDGKHRLGILTGVPCHVTRHRKKEQLAFC